MASEAVDFPLGINLGLDHLTSAYLKAKGEVVVVAAVETTQEWKELYRHNLRVNRSCEEKEICATSKGIYELIYSTLISIRDASLEKLGQPHEINAITLPEHWRNDIYSEVVVDAAIKVYPAFKYMLQARSYLNTIRLAYDLNSGEALGYGPGSKLDEQDCFLVHVDMQKSFLWVYIASVDPFTRLSHRQFYIDNFGGSENNASPHEVSNFKTKFQLLITDELSWEPWRLTKLSDFRFVIFSGEGSTSEFKKIHEAITSAFPDFAEKILDSIDPFWAGAIAAAYQAKKFAIKQPDHTFIELSYGFDNGDYFYTNEEYEACFRTEK